MPSQYAEIVQGITDVVSEIPGLLNVLPYEPDTLSDRLFYFVLAEFEILPPAMADMEIRWTWGARLVVEYLTVEEAEPIITSLLPQIITAIFTNLSARDGIADGCVEITSGRAKKPVSQQVMFRVVDFVITATEHFPFGYAL